MYLRAQHRDAPVLSEIVHCDHRPPDDGLWFFYSWGHPIGPVRETATVAEEIGRMLTWSE